MNSNTATSSVQITDKVASRQKSLLHAVLIWGLVAVFYFYDNLLQVSPSAMKPELTLAFTKEAEQFGSLSAYCLYAYGLMQIPAGILLDKFGSRKIITIACALCTLGSFLFGDATTLWQAKIGRIFIGAGAAFALLCCLKVISVWFPRNRYALMTGLTVTVGYLGGAFGLAFVSKVVESFGWRESMQLFAGFGVILCFLLWGIVKESKSKNDPDKTTADSAYNAEAATRSTNTVWQDLKSILKSKQTWIAALFAGLMFVPTLAFGGLWGIPFFVEAHEFDRNTAGICASMMYLGWVFGGSFWGFVSDYLGRRNLPMIVGNIITFIITVVIIYVDHLPVPVLKGLLFGLGFFSSSFLIAFAVVAESNASNLAATASGFTNALNTLWGALAQPFIGFLLDCTSRVPSSVGEVTSFSLIQYQKAFITLPSCVLLSLIILMFLKETYCGRSK